MLVYAHRCRGFGFAEASVRAIRTALLSQVDGILLDVRLTKDKKFVVPLSSDVACVHRIHTKNLGMLARDALALSTVLAMVASLGKKQVLLDVRDAGEERLFVRMLESYGVCDQTIVLAWDATILERIHRSSHALKLGFSLAPPVDSMGGDVKEEHVAHTYDARLGLVMSARQDLVPLPALPLVCVQVSGLLCTKKFVEGLQAHGIKVLAYPVNNALAASIMRRRAVDGVITDDPKTVTPRVR